jgi:hypothetical protein
LHEEVKELDEVEGKLLELLLPIVRPFDSPPPELNDGGGREGTAVGTDVNYTKLDGYVSIRGNEGSVMVENISVHESV